ncbi:sensor histidine kinase [Kitasatospora sp. NPDC001175]|uniref:sensor histidine kinase n=1 Tax=Kitasatospora sp. NPDC001175 TaxID=3157103 RepID=UPI003D006E02
MSATPSSSLLKRVPPGGWMALIWFAATAYPVAQRVDELRWWPQRANDPQLSIVERIFGSSYGNFGSVVMAAALVLLAARRRRRPLPAVALLLAATVLSTMGLSVKDIPLLQSLAVDVAVCFIAATEPRRTSVATAVMSLAVLGGYTLTRVALDMMIYTPTLLIVALTTVVAWLIGNAIHENHVHADALRAQATDQAVTAERLRIARELHDMVAHSIGIIAIQSGVAARVIDTQPAEARNAMKAVEATSRETLAGLRRTLVALRQSDRADGAEPSDGARVAPTAPAPGLADVERLAETTSAGAGVRVEVEWRGERRPLPPDVDLSAFRIVQEAVTNVVRHAGTRDCRVSIDYQEKELSVEVVDDGRGGAMTGPGAGLGLVGMRERVGLLQGQLTVGPRPEGGFRVAARLPLPAGA